MAKGDDIREDGTVDGYMIETVYCEIKSFERREGEDFLRLIVDHDFQDVEIRISAEYLKRMENTLKCKHPEYCLIVPKD